ncbi:MAG: bifunctional adenosylcobinamide kinase/adenosylcobinamide-phosphate guanylyltransferase [Deltaproteobacteria bacterium HGW-Deltaproteobacteria-1]|jgi:adenosylcobinamide kinase/adenosylcobinamide-phosphate guanylyltransferase|nr:MAG: bifunctional adenosylcobinamide kinase/adenosylcobinamide-phosphate guanylyltransferase [Deltaproteobacteria bacterium HGW-Deltaproteobacteria-1]
MIPEIPVNGLTLFLGGARSGKSSFAEKIARDSGKSVLYIATAAAGDDEMAERIRNHQASRPAQWQTLECPLNIGRRLDAPRAEVVIVDCITLLVSNILLSFREETPAETIMHKVSIEMEEIIDAQSRISGQWLVVSNEVGLGLVPPYPQGRIYRDVLGRANQILAKAASRVILMVAGIPMVVK